MKIDYSQLDDAICEFLINSDGHPTNSRELLTIAEGMTTGVPWRLIDRRIQIMTKAGRIRYTGKGRNNPSGRSHGWQVLQNVSPIDQK